MLWCKTNSSIVFFKPLLEKKKLALTIMTMFFFLRRKKRNTFFSTNHCRLKLSAKKTKTKTKTHPKKFNNTLRFWTQRIPFLLTFALLRNINMVLVTVWARYEKIADSRHPKEAFFRSCSAKKLFLKIFQKVPEHICAVVFFLTKLQDL